MQLRTALLLVAARVATAQVPVVDCVVQNKVTRDFVGYFGYTSNTTPQTIPVGPTNTINNSGMLFGNLPTDFTSQAAHTLFAVRFGPTGSATWTLNGQTATATPAQVTSPPCQPAVGDLFSGAQDRCWDTHPEPRQPCEPDPATGDPICPEHRVVCGAIEDLDGDGFCTILDCVGLPGPPGAAGPAGPPGTQGPAGPAGQIALHTVQVVSSTSNATVACGATQFLVTGGGVCTVKGRVDLGRVRSSRPNDSGDGWSVACDLGSATAVAVCAARSK